MNRLLLSSPVGPLLASYEAEGVTSLRFWRQGEHPPAGTRDVPARGDATGERLTAELSEYFSGERTAFTIPLLVSGTEFQQEVWAALRAIPPGETRSYAQIAAAVGRPRAARAVGQANARNRLPIFVPCHRVLASDGSLGGFLGEWGGAGNGLSIKRWLLKHEHGASGAAPAAAGGREAFPR